MEQGVPSSFIKVAIFSRKVGSPSEGAYCMVDPVGSFIISLKTWFSICFGKSEASGYPPPNEIIDGSAPRANNSSIAEGLTLAILLAK